MNIKKLLIGGAAGALMLGALAVSAFAANNGTTVYRFSDEPFNYNQCYTTNGFFPGPAATFGQDVCVNYVAQNAETVRVGENSGISWSLTQHGTATVTASTVVNSGQVLYEGPFQVQEIARDPDGDATSCLTADHHAYIGHCSWTDFSTNLDFLRYNWMITGNSIYSFNATINGAGNWCYSSKQGGVFGPGCLIH